MASDAALTESIDIFRALAAECRGSAVFYDEQYTRYDATAEYEAAAANMRRGALRWDALADRLTAFRTSLSTPPEQASNGE